MVGRTCRCGATKFREYLLLSGELDVALFVNVEKKKDSSVVDFLFVRLIQRNNKQNIVCAKLWKYFEDVDLINVLTYHSIPHLTTNQMIPNMIWVYWDLAMKRANE